MDRCIWCGRETRRPILQHGLPYHAVCFVVAKATLPRKPEDAQRSMS